MMFYTVFIAFVGLIALVSLHELGHFLTAKKFGVKVEELGIGYPPRLWSKKRGETVYSLNLLPFGAFVRIPEDEGPNSFFVKPWWQRALIVFNGAASFWLITLVLFSVVSVLGLPEIVDDAETGLPNTRVQISSVLPNSPAEAVGLKPGDSLEQLVDPAGAISISRVQQVQDLIDRYRGKNITLVVKRGEQVLSFAVSPRLSPPSGQGPLGVTLARTVLRTYPWWQALWQGLKSTAQVTVLVVSAYKDSLVKLWQGSPTGLSLMGPVGIIGLLSQGLNMGVSYFLQMIGVLSISAAVVNLLPIPAFDGGKLAFIFLEAIRRKPVSRQLEERVSTVFFGLLIILMVVVTFKDIRSFF